ncbi:MULTISPECIES: hypothetical protein [Pseudomonas]|uniref:Uncharacterized protein n=1 Tax=Pseudomonas luteola TaxID=47886 RepID=A0ABS0FPM6_PSELU|nr:MULTISPECIES: hypothetical protein [Pseudomonas]MBF8642289.1 hypothetical protein [Pseudomonas zeshuii]RRW48329.1 hypothetical protein EGJ50_10225 [Pseudomonas luteola]SHJ23948.1 hypothetical protein SAMN05216295_109204 [Pseudomonas zeshuii]
MKPGSKAVVTSPIPECLEMGAVVKLLTKVDQGDEFLWEGHRYQAGTDFWWVSEEGSEPILIRARDLEAAP